MVSFSGIGSGLDLSALVDQVVAAEKIPAQALAQRRTAAGRQSTTLSDLVSKLKGLGAKLAALDTASELRPVIASTADAERVGVTASSAATPGTHTVKVLGLARSETRQSRAFATAGELIGGAGTLTIQVGDDDSVPVTFAANDTIGAIATRINESDARVRASVLYTGSSYRLMIASADTGAANAISFSESGTGSLGFLASDAIVTEASDATFELDGLPISRPTNQISDALEGVSFTLRSETPSGGAATEITIAADRDGTKAKVKSVIDAYNEVAKLMAGQMGEAAAQNSKSGSLFGDSTLQSLQRAMGGAIATGYAHGATTTSLGEMGIKLSSDGTLSLDETKFDKAYAADPEKLTALFASGGEEDLRASLDSVIERYTQAGDGLLMARKKGLDQRSKDLQADIARIEEHAEAVGARLRKQFATLDKTLSSLQSQTSYLSSLYF